jgi:hypothetical protein
MAVGRLLDRADGIDPLDGERFEAGFDGLEDGTHAINGLRPP